MQDSSRRVNRLKLSSRSEETLHGDIAALQDAFRIASLPGIPPQGLLLIRRLDLGVIRTRTSALTLSCLIDNRIRNSAPTAVRADHGDFTEQPLVWFSDLTAAAIGLAENVAASRNPRAWYWQTLFPQWRQGMNLADTLVAIAAGRQAQAPPAAVLRLVIAGLIESTPTERLADAITLPLAQSLLRDAGVYRGPSAVAGERSAAPIETEGSGLLPSWKKLVSHALARWGAEDPRCLWLGYCALTAQNPALASDPNLYQRIETILTGLAGSAGSAGAQIQTEATASDNSSDPFVRPRSTGSATTGESSGPAKQSKATPGQADAAAPDTVSATTDAAAQAAASLTTARAQEHRSRHQSQPAATARSASEVKSSGREAGQPDPMAAESLSPDPPPPPPEADPAADPFIFDGLVDSDHAGLAFILSLFELLAIDRLLENNPVLAEINLPAVILRDIALRQRIPRGHALLLALPELPRYEAKLESFDSPEPWRTLLRAPGGAPVSLHRFDTSRPDSHCYLTDRSRRLLLYAGSGDLPRWTRRHRITRHAGVYPVPDAYGLSQGLQLLMSRYLRRYAGISLRRLVHRQGRFAGTRTHIDVLFDARQTDIQVRKAGLDVNPGWVPWLARVVQFHYQDGDSVDV